MPEGYPKPLEMDPKPDADPAVVADAAVVDPVVGADAPADAGDASGDPITGDAGADAEGTADGTAASDATEAPESYAFEAHEGKELDKDIVEEVTPLFKELGLSQDAAQKLVNAQIDLSVKAEAHFAEQMAANAAEIKKLHGEDYEVRARGVQQLVKQFGTPELVAKLKATGLSADKDVFEFLNKVRQGFSEDSLTGAGTQGKKKVRLGVDPPEQVGDAFYGNATKPKRYNTDL